jgi:pyruvate/2-oxoglutarate dehydrogenase complex dihydrolipoamide acyltransferase (E2) component
MKTLLADRMAKRRTLIQKALQSAKQRDEGRVAIEVLDGVTGDHLTPLSGISQLSLVGPGSRGSSTSVGVAVMPERGSDGHPDAVPPVAAEPGKPRASGLLKGLLLAAAAGGGVYVATMHSRTPPPSAPTPAAQVAAVPTTTPAVATAAPPVGATPAEPSASAEEATSANVVDMELDAPGSKTSGTKRHIVGRAPIAAKAPAAKPAAAPAPAAPPKPADTKAPGAKPFVSPFREPDF